MPADLTQAMGKEIRSLKNERDRASTVPRSLKNERDRAGAVPPKSYACAHGKEHSNHILGEGSQDRAAKRKRFKSVGLLYTDREEPTEAPHPEQMDNCPLCRPATAPLVAVG